VSGSHIRGWLDIARRTVACALKGHDWRNYRYSAEGVWRFRRECRRCWKDEAR
jgi:hypothetical protein